MYHFWVCFYIDYCLSNIQRTDLRNFYREYECVSIGVIYWVNFQALDLLASSGLPFNLLSSGNDIHLYHDVSSYPALSLDRRADT